MKVLRQLENPACRTTLFWWNNKYILKFETPFFEQTYKISEMDVTSETEVSEVIDSEEFMQKIIQRFKEMNQDWNEQFVL
jgi:hypothetical protein